jgi:hypothetical protein
VAPPKTQSANRGSTDSLNPGQEDP